MPPITPFPSITIIPLNYSEGGNLDCSNKFFALDEKSKYVLLDFKEESGGEITKRLDEIFEIEFNITQDSADIIKTIKKVHEDGTVSGEYENLRTDANKFLEAIYEFHSKPVSTKIPEGIKSFFLSGHIGTETGIENNIPYPPNPPNGTAGEQIFLGKSSDTTDVITGANPEKAEEANAHLLKKLQFLKYDFGISEEQMKEILELVIERDELNKKPF